VPRLAGLSLAGGLFLVGCTTNPKVSSSSPSAIEHPQPTVLAGAAPAAVQPGVPAAPITLEAAVERAATFNTQIKALRAAVAVAQQRKSAATDIEDPEALIAWGNIGDDLDNSGHTRGAGSDLRTGGRMAVPNPFLMVPRVSARTADFLAAKADLQAARWQVECAVRRLFAELNYLAEDLALTGDLVRQNSDILKDTRARAEQGAATISDAVAAAQHQLQAQNDLDQARHRYQLAQRELAALLDLSPASLQLATNALPTFSLPEAAIGAESMLGVAVRHRGDVAALRWRTLAARSSYHEARNVRIPWFQEAKAWHRDLTDEWWVGFGVNVPIFSWTKNHAGDVLQAQYDLAGVNENNGLQLVRHEVHDAVDELEERRRQQARNQSEVAPLIAQMRRSLQVLKKTPNRMPAQVAVTEAQILESTRLELASRWHYRLALLDLERVVGAPLSVALQAGERKM
ncbi:MAG TPA: TolC family protein, partial [Candidatus Sulfotelmatobacter sp.]|nr:TolC family protein [Candidatus Sulfotelmatobacter sp.]